MTSYMTWGILTGWLDGQVPSAPTPLCDASGFGYAIWLMWSALSVFFPSQHVGKVMTDRMPPTQKPVGRVWESGAAQLRFLLSPVAGMQRWHTLGAEPGEVAAASPTSMRKPGVNAVTLTDASGDAM